MEVRVRIRVRLRLRLRLREAEAEGGVRRGREVGLGHVCHSPLP